MAATVDGARSLLVEVKGVAGGWPFYGELVVEPDRPLAELLAGGRVSSDPGPQAERPEQAPEVNATSAARC